MLEIKRGGSQEEMIPVKEIYINRLKSDKQIVKGDTLHLVAVIVPENATNKTISWKSQNLDIATVDSNGIVNVIGDSGTCEITAIASNGRQAAYTVIVNQRAIYVQSISLPENLELGVDSTIQLHASISPVNATNKTLKWETDDERVAYVNQEGMMFGIGKGNCTITATSTDGSGIHVSMKVYVNPSPQVILISSIELNDKEIEKGTSIQLKPIIRPTDATCKNLEWKSNSSDVDVNQKGVVDGKKSGVTAKITAKATDGSGVEASCIVKISDKPFTPKFVEDYDMGYATYTGPFSNGHPNKGGVLTIKRECELPERGGYMKFTKGDKITITSYSISSDNTVVIQGDLSSPGNEKKNLFIYP